MRRFNSQLLNDAVQKVYYGFDNYEIKYIDKSNDTVYIFFSSNGLYYPDDVETFNKQIGENNYYEWKKLSCHQLILSKACKIIFVRDVYKSWYIQGISNKLSTQDKLADFLKSVTEGKRIVTIGVSAGGTAAILFGCLLKADRIVAFCPQINLYLANEQGQISGFDEFSADEIRSKYLNLIPYIKQYTGILIYVFPKRNFKDNSQYDLIKNENNIKFFASDSKSHGVVFYPENIAILIGETEEKVLELQEYFKTHKCSPSKFLRYTNGFFFFFKCISRSFVKKIFRKIKRYLER